MIVDIFFSHEHIPSTKSHHRTRFIRVSFLLDTNIFSAHLWYPAQVTHRFI